MVLTFWMVWKLDIVWKFYAPQTKILERRKKFRWVVLEALFITFSPNIALFSMKSASKTSHRKFSDVPKSSFGEHKFGIFCHEKHKANTKPKRKRISRMQLVPLFCAISIWDNSSNVLTSFRGENI